MASDTNLSYKLHKKNRIEGGVNDEFSARSADFQVPVGHTS